MRFAWIKSHDKSCQLCQPALKNMVTEFFWIFFLDDCLGGFNMFWMFALKLLEKNPITLVTSLPNTL